MDAIRPKGTLIERHASDLAERENFIVVYPFITTYDGPREENCWGFPRDHIHEALEIEDLYQIALRSRSRD